MRFLTIFTSLLRKDFIKIKHRYSLHGKVQVHHIIPLEWKSHANLKDYNIDAGYNLMFLPTKRGKIEINTIRRIHDGGHSKYNKFVKEQLDLEVDPYYLSYTLRDKLIHDGEVPW